MQTKVTKIAALVLLAVAGVGSAAYLNGQEKGGTVVTVPFNVPPKAPDPKPDTPPEPAPKPDNPNDAFQIADSAGKVINSEIEVPVGKMLTLHVVGVPTPFDSDKPVPRVGWVIVPLTEDVRSWYDGYVVDFTSDKAGSFLFIATRNSDDPLDIPLRRPIVVRFVDGKPVPPGPNPPGPNPPDPKPPGPTPTVPDDRFGNVGKAAAAAANALPGEAKGLSSQTAVIFRQAADKLENAELVSVTEGADWLRAEREKLWSSQSSAWQAVLLAIKPSWDKAWPTMTKPVQIEFYRAVATGLEAVK